MILPSNNRYPPRFMAAKNRKYITRSPKGKKITNQRRSSRTFLSNTHNLQERRESDGETNHIPSIINGTTNMTHTSRSNPGNNVSVRNLLHELRETINVNSRELRPPSKKHKVVLIGDSNTRGYVYKLESLLNNNYELYSVIKPGATTSELKETAKEEVSRLSCNDVILISYGINDYEVNNFSLTWQNIIDFIQRNNHTNIILMNLPYRYDLPNSITVNRIITSLNRKLKKTSKAFPFTYFMEMNSTRSLFTNHGLHMNKLAKQLVTCQIATFLYSIFEQKKISSHQIKLV
jgi:lysophospholipase L1-like esterase